MLCRIRPWVKQWRLVLLSSSSLPPSTPARLEVDHGHGRFLSQLSSAADVHPPCPVVVMVVQPGQGPPQEHPFENVSNPARALPALDAAHFKAEYVVLEVHRSIVAQPVDAVVFQRLDDAGAVREQFRAEPKAVTSRWRRRSPIGRRERALAPSMPRQGLSHLLRDALRFHPADETACVRSRSQCQPA